MTTTFPCPRCSKTLPASAAFCRRCGATLRSPPVPGRSSPVVSAVPRKRPGSAWGRRVDPVVVVLAFAALGVGLLVAGFYFRRSAVARGQQAVTVARSAEARDQQAVTSRVPFSSRTVTPSLPPLPPLPKWERHVPADVRPIGKVPAAIDFRGQMLTQRRFLSESLDGAVFAGTQLLQCNFEQADLRRADFRGAQLTQSNLTGADLADARFDRAMLSSVTFVGVDTAAVAGKTRVRNGVTEPVPPPPLEARNVDRASFKDARIDTTTFDGLDLQGATFAGAELRMVNFRDADLRGADLRNTRHAFTDFAGARLDGADLRGADLSSARNLTESQLAKAKTDATTRRARW